MKYRELTPAEQEAYEVGYRVGNRQIVITDIEWESEHEHAIYRKGYLAGFKDYKRKVNKVNSGTMSTMSTKSTSRTPRDTRALDTVTVMDTVTEVINPRNDISKLSTTRTQQFNPPTLQQVLDYARTQNSVAGMGGFACTQELAEQFWSHYESIGWRVGNENRTPITNWQSKLRNWAAKDKQGPPVKRVESEKERKARENHEKLEELIRQSRAAQQKDQQ